MSPAESMLDLINIDFAREGHEDNRLENLVGAWETSLERRMLRENIKRGEHDNDVFTLAGPIPKGYPRNLVMQTWIQLRRMALVSNTRTMRILTIRTLIVISWPMAFVSPCMLVLLF